MPDKQLTPDEMGHNSSVLRHIKTWLKHRDRTQRELANHLGLSEASISKWLKGQQAITMTQFVEVAKFLDASPERLFSAPSNSPFENAPPAPPVVGGRRPTLHVVGGGHLRTGTDDAQADRCRSAAEVAQGLSDDNFAAWIQVGRAMQARGSSGGER